MASQFVDLPLEGGSGGSGITSINGDTTAAQTIAAGSGISVVSAGGTTTISNTGGSGTVTSVSVVSANGLAGSVATATTTPAITLSTTITGILQGNGTAISAATTGNLTDAGTDGIVVTGGTGAVLGSGTSIAQHVADSTHNGYLSSTDWSTFNGKQGSGNYITALTGDVTASGPGSAAATLATVNSNVGSFGSSTAIPSFTVNGKGLITAASTNVVIAPAGTLTGTTLASNVVTSSLTAVGTIATGVWQGTLIGAQYGGTGVASLTANNVILGNGTSAVQFVAPGTSGNVLQSNGTTWTSAAITAVTGSGTTATIPKWSSSSALTDSNITINATGNVLITGVAPANAGAAFLTTVTASTSAGTYYNGRFSTTAPSSANAVNLYGLFLPINGGSMSSASALTVGVRVDNQTTVGTAIIDGWNFTGSIAAAFTSRAANSQTNGGNIGVTVYAGGGNINTGYQSQIDSVAGTTPKAIGYASGINSTGVSTLVGYYVKVGTTSNAALMSPSPTASALFFGDNGSSAVDLINLQSAASTAFKVADNGTVTASTGSVIINTAGKGLSIKEGSNAKMGQSVMVAGTVTVSNTSVTANSRIFLTTAVAGGVLGVLSVGTVVNGTSFVINSSSPTDTSTVNWLLIEAA